MTDFHDYNRPGYTGATGYPNTDPAYGYRSGSSTGIIVALAVIAVLAIVLFAFAGSGTDTSTTGVQTAPNATVQPVAPANEPAAQPAVPATPQIAPGEQVQ